MRKFVILIVLIAPLYFFSSAFYPSQKATSNQAAELVKEQFVENIENLLDNLNKLKGTLNSKKKDRIEYSLIIFKNCRDFYKRIEFLLEYFSPDFVKANVNGANLYWLNETVPEIEEMAPHGFQVIEENLFGEEPNLDLVNEELVFLIRNLEMYKRRRQAEDWYDYQVWEAMRIELIRVFTLGITGFDSPILSNSIAEAKASYTGILQAFMVYKYGLGVIDKDAALAIENYLKASIAFLKENNEFDTFDRVVFYKKFYVSLSSELLNAQKILGFYLPMGKMSPVNYETSELFADNFLYTSYYSKFKTEGNKKITHLGKLLFFDPILSSNNKRACASCHVPQKAFSDGKKTSLALDFNGTVDRNSPGLINSVYSTKYFHDLRAESIEDQTEHVLLAHNEFATNYKEVVEKLLSSAEYVALFNASFGTEKGSINRNTIAFALAEYVRSLVAINSPFDQYMRNEMEIIDEKVINGANLFMGKAGCATCHFAPIFNGTVPPAYIDSESEVLGVLSNDDLDHPVIDNDLGRYNTRKQGASIFYKSFKTPTVRNVALTAPYMHNGAFESLDLVLQFYNKGGGAGLGLDVPNQTLPSENLNLTDVEIAEIIAFMHSLTDTTNLLSTPKWLPDFASDSLNKRTIGGEY